MKTIEKITSIVAKYYGIEYWTIFKVCRKEEVLKPRQVAQYLAKKHTKLSYEKIGRFFNQEHLTVINSEKKVQERLDTYRNFKSEIEDIKMLLFQSGIIDKQPKLIVKVCNPCQMMIYKATG